MKTFGKLIATFIILMILILWVMGLILSIIFFIKDMILTISGVFNFKNGILKSIGCATLFALLITPVLYYNYKDEC